MSVEVIGVVCKDLAFLKLLYPICEQLHLGGNSYVLYLHDFPRGEKEYNRASWKNVENSSPSVMKWSKKTETFSTIKHLYQKLTQDGISKLISVEIGMWLERKKFPNHIKTYSIQYLADSLWNPSNNGITKVYHTSKFLMDSHYKLNNLVPDQNRDRAIGSPIFDPLANEISSGKDTLVLLPNLRAEHVNKAFGSANNFIEMIRRLSKGTDLIFKTRKKQWLPKEIIPFAKEILDDGGVMYPPRTAELFTRCNTTIMFYSGGIYEAVFGGQYVINIPLPLNRWAWNINKLKAYCESDLYNFKGVVEKLEQSTILKDNWELGPTKVDPSKRLKWMEKFIGGCASCPSTAAKDIVLDIMGK